MPIEKIAVVGTGYVGLAMSMVLGQHNEVVALDIDEKKVICLNKGECPLDDEDIKGFMVGGQINFRATTDKTDAYSNARFVIIATPTNYNPENNGFDTQSIEDVVADVTAINPTAVIVIKSTVPVGYTAQLAQKLDIDSLIFSPEFLREGKALHDNLYPSRIVVGEKSPRAEEFALLLLQGSRSNHVPILYVDPEEAEAIKLFSNTYLAMRVAFFNELDSYAIHHKLDTRALIEGVCLDPRIGSHYNNPSFGYGGYCLPKDTQQLLANYSDVPQNLINAIVQANATRKDLIAFDILQKKPGTVGIYRLSMKKESDNFRESCVIDVMAHLRSHGVKLVVYEPKLRDVEVFNGAEVVVDLHQFKTRSDLIVANRLDAELKEVMSKVYTRDIFSRD